MNDNDEKNNFHSFLIFWSKSKLGIRLEYAENLICYLVPINFKLILTSYL
jgi:hypothetical protein